MQTAVDLVLERHGLALQIELGAGLLRVRGCVLLAVWLIGVANVLVFEEVLPPNN